MESLPGTLPTPSRLAIDVVIRDTPLHCIWTNDIQTSEDGIPSAPALL
ncbi:hypothetical protein OG894_40260 [Streptomyces sp. NBC_01724]|nr:MULTISPECIES: hypothetical protein [unclassified Streptomyces]WTE49494.1 hypothetical protein OG987_01535 [Streptomyces sp. NBC_01620]WTE57580.1 hypothetical protein OG784_01655 [Streptomyces sp. NBC_01617]WTI85093.1 hypothetical protein OHB17_02005 [Streptomyces sp. NBC_00724]WNO62630.1 hypothetical protein RPQ02_01860 [Streptomyces sp. AM2-3-1]WSC67211.1 hypothetical protein OG807_01445 [Streptomyces sp. NBC_01760]